MLETKKQFFKLLKFSNEFKKKNKSFFKEDPDSSRQLSKFLIKIEDNLHLREKNTYIKLIKLFLDNQINAEDFSFYFIAQYDKINSILHEMEQNFEERFDELVSILNENPNQKSKIGELLMFMYDNCDDFQPNSNSGITDEENLRNSAKVLLDELNKT